MTEITKEEMRNRLGNVTQLQELLFGDKIKEYNHKFEQNQKYLHKLEADIDKLRLNLENNLKQLENSLTHKIESAVDSLEKKLKYLSLTTQDETSKLKQEVKNISKTSYDSINSIQENLNSQATNLKTELVQTKEIVDKDLQTLKQQLLERIEKNFAEVSNEKVSRGDLAEVLFELCLKVKGTDFVPNLKEAANNGIKTDFLLPEEQVNENSQDN
ncbi:MAG: hypothetical protein ACFCU5_00505 [Pleurocapsa sp.]